MANEFNQTSSLRGPARDLRGLLIAVFAGITFGFLLQKGGVGKYNVLIGQLLLEDFTVVKVMLTAIIVGMIGIFVLHRFGLVELHVIGPRFLVFVKQRARIRGGEFKSLSECAVERCRTPVGESKN